MTEDEPEIIFSEYTQTVTIDGKTRQAYGTACRQPDGSWTLAD